MTPSVALKIVPISMLGLLVSTSLVQCSIPQHLIQSRALVLFALESTCRKVVLKAQQLPSCRHRSAGGSLYR